MNGFRVNSETLWALKRFSGKLQDDAAISWLWGVTLLVGRSVVVAHAVGGHSNKVCARTHGRVRAFLECRRNMGERNTLRLEKLGAQNARGRRRETSSRARRRQPARQRHWPIPRL